MFWATACFLAAAASAPVAVMVDKPVTVAVSAPEPVRRSKSVLLQMEGVLVRRNAPVMWNVFWDMPDATAETSVDNVHFAGYVALPANSAVHQVRPVNLTLQLPAAAVEAVHRRTSMHFTFVPVKKLPEGGVAITSLRLE